MNYWSNATLVDQNEVVGGTYFFTNNSGGKISTINVTYEENLETETLVIPVTIIYVIIFFTGLIGNVSTCIVISRNKSMHTATNYYLFSLAISDLLLLLSGLPPETYRIWCPQTYVFGEVFCVVQGFAAETSANATVLTITAFTVERYLAICHPFLSYTMSKLSRAVKYIIAIWIIALCLAVPQAIQFGVKYEILDGIQQSHCTVVSTSYFQHSFEISSFVFFVGPMTLITVLYVLIALKLRKSRTISLQKRSAPFNNVNNESCSSRTSKSTAAQKRVIKMLVAVVVAFFLCWAPFHSQRLLAVYLVNASPENQLIFVDIYIVLEHTSGVLYFLSTTINPVLYNIMSKKFREAFKTTFSQVCRTNSSRRFDRTYSSLLRHPQSFNNNSNALERARSGRIRSENKIDAAASPTNNYNKGPRESVISEIAAVNGKFRPRMTSECSQTTLLTTLSKSLSIDDQIEYAKPPPFARSVSKINATRQFMNIGQPARRHHLNKHKEGILSYGMFRLFNKQANQNKFSREGSVESAHSSNTISNSSLHDMDGSEFNSTELAEYMEEMNKELT